MSRGVIFTKKFIVKLYIFLKPLFLWKTVVFGGRVFLQPVQFLAFDVDKRGPKNNLTRAKTENQKPKTVSQTVNYTLSLI